MKKLFCVFLALMLLSACSAAPDSAGVTNGTDATTAPTVTEPTATEPTATEPTVTEPPVTEPPTTEPPEEVEDPEDPEDPPVEIPFEPHDEFSADACASLIGTWSTKIKLTNELQYLDMFTGKTSFTLYYTFEENGRFTAWVNQDEFTAAIDDFEALMVDHMVELRYTAFRGPLEYQGLEEEAILERWGSGPEQQAREECESTVSSLNLYHRFKQLTREGQYYVSGAKLYTQVSAERFEANGYTVNGKAMTLNNTNYMSIYRDICVDFPMVFQKSE